MATTVAVKKNSRKKTKKRSRRGGRRFRYRFLFLCKARRRRGNVWCFHQRWKRMMLPAARKRMMLPLSTRKRMMLPLEIGARWIIRQSGKTQIREIVKIWQSGIIRIEECGVTFEDGRTPSWKKAFEYSNHEINKTLVMLPPTSKEIEKYNPSCFSKIDNNTPSTKVAANLFGV